jgi:hypothetical protein
MTAPKGYMSAKPLIKEAIAEVLREYFGYSTSNLTDNLVKAVEAAQRQHNRQVFGQED